MLDPLIQLIISLGFTLLFAMAGLHKLGNRLQFQGILADYQILPPGLVGIVAPIIAMLELALAVFWATGAFSSVVPTITAALLAGYGTAIGVNLLRGRTYIDCGCGFASAAGKNGNENDMQQLSMWLILRNTLLIVAAFASLIPPTIRELGLMDYFTAILASLALVLFYGAFNQLLSNNNAIGAWRNPA